MKSLKSLNKYFYRYKYHLAFGVLCVIISNLFAIIPAQIVRHSFDLVNDSISLYFAFGGLDLQQNFYGIFATSILIYGLLIVAMALLRGFFLFLMRQTIIVMSRHIEYDQKNEIYQHYQALSLSFYRQHNTGDLMARISEDVSRVRMYTGPAIMYGINLVIVFVLVIGYMISVNPMLTLYSLLPLPILSFSIYYVNQIIQRRSDEIQKSLSRLSTFTQEAFSGIRVIKAFVREQESTGRFNDESNEYRHRSLQLNQVNSFFFPLMSGLIGLSTILTVYVGGIEVMKGNITTGNIAEFVIYINMLTWPVTSLGWVTSIMQRSAASQKRIDEFINTLPEITSNTDHRVDIRGDLSFKDVSFTYGYSGTKALRNISFDVKAGEAIAIMGTTGAGKSTIAQLIARMYDTTGGQVLVDGQDIKDYNIRDLRSQMAQVPQDVFLFSDSIYNNVAFGAPTSTEGAVVQAIKDADLYENMSSFPEGIQTKIGERGITLSGGQKQRVSIARALVLNPKVLVLDDCLSAVDTKTEDTILRNLKRIMDGKTTVIISHRVSSAKLADKVLILSDGEVIAQGKHEDLLQNNQWYLEQALKEQEGASADNLVNN